MNTLCWKFWIGRKKGEFHTIKTNRQGHESMGDWEQISMSFCSSIILNIFVLNLFKKKKKRTGFLCREPVPEGMIQQKYRGSPTASPRVTPVLCLSMYEDPRWFFIPLSNNFPPFPADSFASEPKPVGFQMSGVQGQLPWNTSPGTSWGSWWGVSPSWIEGWESPGYSKVGDLSYDMGIAATCQHI